LSHIHRLKSSDNLESVVGGSDLAENAANFGGVTPTLTTSFASGASSQRTSVPSTPVGAPPGSVTPTGDPASRRISGQPVSNSSPISKSQSWPLAINSAPREGGHGASPQVAATAGSAVAASMDDSAVEAQVCLCSMCTLRFPFKMSVVIKVLQSGIIVIVTKFVSGSKLFQNDEISVFAFNPCTSRKTSEPRSGRRLPPRRQAPRPRKSSSLFRIYTSPSRCS